jgi:hypothetical protein
LKADAASLPAAFQNKIKSEPLKCRFLPSVIPKKKTKGTKKTL